MVRPPISPLYLPYISPCKAIATADGADGAAGILRIPRPRRRPRPRPRRAHAARRAIAARRRARARGCASLLPAVIGQTASPAGCPRGRGGGCEREARREVAVEVEREAGGAGAGAAAQARADGAAPPPPRRAPGAARVSADVTASEGARTAAEAMGLGRMP